VVGADVVDVVVDPAYGGAVEDVVAANGGGVVVVIVVAEEDVGDNDVVANDASVDVDVDVDDDAAAAAAVLLVRVEDAAVVILLRSSASSRSSTTVFTSADCLSRDSFTAVEVVAARRASEASGARELRRALSCCAASFASLCGLPTAAEELLPAGTTAPTVAAEDEKGRNGSSMGTLPEPANNAPELAPLPATLALVAPKLSGPPPRLPPPPPPAFSSAANCKAYW